MGVTSGERHEGHGFDPGGSERMRGREEPTVRILEGLFSPHLNNLQRALGRATERQALLTNNLANVNTPGYKRRDVDFSIVLDEEMNPAGPEGAARKVSQLSSQSAGGSIRVDGNSVDLETEVFSLAETELRYQALTDMTATYFQGLKNAIREGR
jgi:flagellar basal-body rod protein FlgB